MSVQMSSTVRGLDFTERRVAPVLQNVDTARTVVFPKKGTSQRLFA